MKINAEKMFIPEFLEGKFCIKEENGVITEIENRFCDDAINGRPFYVAPGFVDVHIHGFGGFDISEGSVDALFNISKSLAKTGTANFLPTFVAIPFNELKKIIESLTPILKKAKGSFPLGFHIEGGFVNKNKCGAMNPRYFLNPSIQYAEELIYYKSVKMFTVAPELNGAIDVIAFLKNRGVAVSIGHTEANFETARSAFLAGAESITHLFNAMPHFHHRDTGVIGAAFSLPFYLQFIGDGVHTSREVFKIMHLVKERVALITDSTEAGGMPGGKYMLGDYEIFTDGISARLEDGTLAGSVLSMDRGVRNLIRFGGFSREEAIRAATEIPARSIGEFSMGKIKKGAYSDFVFLDENFEVKMTISKGRVIYDAR